MDWARSGQRGPVGHTIQRPWGKLRVWRSGAAVGPGAQVVLALHGLGGSGRYWDALAGALEQRGPGRFMVVAPDLGGFGSSDKPEGVAYDRAFHLDNVDAAIADLETGDTEGGAEGRQALRVHVVGHSMGGVLAALWAAHHSERVASLALAAAPYPGPAVGGLDLDPSRRPRGSRKPLSWRVVDAVWPWVTLPAPLFMRRQGYTREIIVDYLRSTLESYYGTADALLRTPLEQVDLDGLARLSQNTPQLLLNAADDGRVTLADAAQWATRLPHAKRAVVPAGGHGFLLPTRFTALADWLVSLPD
jgi:pimeloyl-ACP methyl ester carboxylesterase